MKREVRLLLLELNGTQIGELDLEDFDDFNLKLTKAISSIKDIRLRSTSYSLDFKVPKTKNNNKILNGVRFINHSKDILGQKQCIIIADGNQIDKGFVYAYESAYEDFYKLVFKGGNNDWLELIKGLELNALKWKDYSSGNRSVDALEFFDSSRITILNQSNSSVADVIYPYIDRNNGGRVSDLRPQIHLRSFFLALFDTIGYSIDSNFLNSEWILGNKAFTDSFGNAYIHLGLGIDPAFYLTRDQNDLIAVLSDYKSSGINASLPATSWNTNNLVGNISTPSSPNIRPVSRFPGIINVSLEDNSSLFNIPTSEYTVTVGGVYEVNTNFKYQFAFWDITYPTPKWVNHSQLIAPTAQRPPNFKWIVVKNNTQDYSIDGTVLFQGVGLVQSNIQQTPSGGLFTFNTGDKISVFLQLVDDAFGFGGVSGPYSGAYAYLNGPGSLQYWKVRILNDSRFTFKAKPSVELGDEYRINSHIPSGIKCLDLLQDLKTTFNLYFDADPNRKTVKIEPRDDFYLTDSVDITDKIDLKTAPVINYLTNYKNRINFSYATDPDDKYLAQWNKIYDKEYARYEHVFSNSDRFENGETNIKTTVLCPTIQGINASTYWIASIIKQEWLDADNLGKGVNSKYRPRIFQLVRGEQHDTANVVRNATFTGDRTFAVMEEFGNLPTYEDRKLTFVGTNGLAQVFYAKTLSNIEDASVVTLKMKISLFEFINWNFRKRYYIDSPEEIKGYYITESIENFDINNDLPVMIKLSRYKDYTGASVTQGNGNININTQNPATPPAPLMVEVNGVIVPVLDNNLNTLYG